MVAEVSGGLLTGKGLSANFLNTKIPADTFGKLKVLLQRKFQENGFPEDLQECLLKLAFVAHLDMETIRFAAALEPAALNGLEKKVANLDPSGILLDTFGNFLKKLEKCPNKIPNQESYDPAQLAQGLDIIKATAQEFVAGLEEQSKKASVGPPPH